MRQAYDYWQDQPGFFSLSNELFKHIQECALIMSAALQFQDVTWLEIQNFICTYNPIMSVIIKSMCCMTLFSFPLMRMNVHKQFHIHQMLISFLNYALSVYLNIANDANVCRHLLAFVLGTMRATLQIKCQLEDEKLITFHLLEK